MFRMTIKQDKIVSEIILLGNRPWRYNPIGTWKVAHSFEQDFGNAFTEYAARHWIGKASSEIDPSTLHTNWTFHVASLAADGLRVFVIPVKNFSAFLDDIKDGVISTRFP